MNSIAFKYIAYIFPILTSTSYCSEKHVFPPEIQKGIDYLTDHEVFKAHEHDPAVQSIIEKFYKTDTHVLHLWKSRTGVINFITTIDGNHIQHYTFESEKMIIQGSSSNQKRLTLNSNMYFLLAGIIAGAAAIKTTEKCTIL